MQPQQPPTGAESWRPPEQIEEYQLIRPLGRGRSGLVYVAHDTLLDRHVAVKLIAAADDTLLGKFLTEARAAARIQHPNVATLYRVGRLDRYAYLVWELVRGKGLHELPRPVAPDRMLAIAIDVVRGLAAAHRRGVLHRDIKPANILLADGGEAKLVDFGLAKLLDAPLASQEQRAVKPSAGNVEGGSSSSERLLGTPYFMSPEAWQGGDVDARSDIYSFGLVLYELLAGEGPFRHLMVRELEQAVSKHDPRPLSGAAPSVPPRLAAIVDRCVRRDPEARFKTADDLLAALETLTPARARGALPDGNPYRGLRAYEAEHRALFFGRSRPLHLAIDRMRSESLLVVTGDSGVGKSSFCAAGLLPAISEGALGQDRRWVMARTVPGRTPLQNVAAALSRLIGEPADALREAIRNEPAELSRRIRTFAKDEHGVLLYLDQMEELVTQDAGKEAELVAEALAAMGDGLPGVRVLATARSDFLSRLAGLPGLAERLPPSLLLLGPMSPGEIREAIVGPAELKGGRFESDALIDALVDSATSAEGSLPLLQFTLAELWERRDRESGVISTASLSSVGGVAGALARHADSVLVQMSAEDRRAARLVLLRLVTVEDTRARRTQAELELLSPNAKPALDALVRGRLLVVSETPEGPTYELAHEALVRGWGTLGQWLAEEAEARALRHRLETAAAEWYRMKQPRDVLWSRAQLAEIEGVSFEGLTARELAFLEASRRASTRTRWVRRGLVAAVILAVASAWGGAQIQNKRRVDQAIATDLAAAEESWSKARSQADELRGVRERAFAAWDAKRPAEGEQEWARMKELAASARALFTETGEQIERALLRDPTREEVTGRYADVLRDRISLERLLSPKGAPRELSGRLALYDRDGSRAASLNAPARLSAAIDPAGAEVRLHRYDGSAVAMVGAAAIEVEAGEYLLIARAPGRVETRAPLLLSHGEERVVELSLPRPEQVPEGWIYLPAGDALFGSDDEEDVRAWFNAVPLHLIQSRAFLIARHETTFEEWMKFLDDLPREEQERRRPRVAGTGFRGMLELHRAPNGAWRITLQPTEHLLSAAAGEKIRYPARSKNAEQDWRRMPVSGISYDDAVAYTEWLDRTGRLRGARLCTEHEWERAARGTARRKYPHGDTLKPDDANFDETYGKQSGGFGPDEVGSHPSSRSPFGLDDLTGNVWEWVTSSVLEGQVVARGGSYYFAGGTARLTNRETPERSYRDLTVGLRVCATR